MEQQKDFLAPKFEGKRFEDHSLPVDLLDDFVALEELIFEVAKQIYLEDNPQRQRVPKGFADNVSLKLTGIESGSTIVKFMLVSALSANNVSVNSQQDAIAYMEKSRDRVLQVISNAKTGKIDSRLMDQKLLAYFNRIGRNLQDDEVINFLPNINSDAVLSKGVRKKILLSRSEKLEYSESISVNAVVSSVDKTAKTYTMDIDGNRIQCAIDESYRATILAAFGEYENSTMVSLKATGIFNAQDKLVRVEHIDAMDILDPFDINVRINELCKLQDNWLDGYGKAPSAELLKRFGADFNQYYSRELPLPAMFPTIEGNLQLEWRFLDGNSVVLEVILSDFSAAYYHLQDGDVKEEANMILTAVDGWQTLNDKLEILI